MRNDLYLYKDALPCAFKHLRQRIEIVVALDVPEVLLRGSYS
jgi:hypothetical protein